MAQIRRDICDFRKKSGVDKVIVLWTANTERFCDVIPGVNDTVENLLNTIEASLLKTLMCTESESVRITGVNGFCGVCVSDGR